MTTNAYITIVAAASFGLVSSMAIDDNKVSGRSENVPWKIEQELHNPHITSDADVPAKCVSRGYTWHCRYTVLLSTTEYNVSIETTYLPAVESFHIKLGYEGSGNIIDDDVAAFNPSPLWGDMYSTGTIKSVCVTLYTVEQTGLALKACIRNDFYYSGTAANSSNLGCFHFPGNQNQVIEGHINPAVGKQIVE